MILQSYDYSELFPTSLLTSVFILLFMLLLMLLVIWKFKIWILGLIIFIFSIIFGTMAFGIAELPFQPYLPLFFLVIQSILFIKLSLDTWKK